MKKLPLGLVLTGGFLGAIAITVGVILFSSYLSTKKVLIEHAHKLMVGVADDAIMRSENFLAPAQVAAGLTKRLADSAVVNGDNKTAMERYFYEQLRLYPQFSGIYYGDRHGDFTFVKKNIFEGEDGYLTKFIAHDDRKREVKLVWRDGDFREIDMKLTPEDSYDPRKRPWFRKAVNAEGLIWTDPYIFFTSQMPGLTTSNPVLNKYGQTVGVVGVDIEIGEISKFLSELELTPNSSAFIMDRTGQVLAYPDPELVKIREKNADKTRLRFAAVDEFADPLVRAAYASLGTSVEKLGYGSSVFSSFEIEEERYQVAFSTFSDPKWPWVVAVYAPEKDFLAELKSNQQLNIIYALIIAISASIVGYFMTRTVSRPMSELRDEALEIKAGKIDHHTNVTTFYSEIADTADAFRQMEDSLYEKMQDNEKLTSELRAASVETMMRLARVAEFNDSSTARHLERMSRYSAAIAKYFDYNEEELESLRIAAVMHDLGKVAVPESIIQKPGRLDDDEWKIMRRHPYIGAEILRDSNSDIICLAREIALTHHERWDGEGYPHGLSGTDIPLSGRICAVADVFDALVSKRSYKNSMSPAEAAKIIHEGSGSQFDPDVVEAFDKAYEDIITIMRDFPEDVGMDSFIPGR